MTASSILEEKLQEQESNSTHEWEHKHLDCQHESGSGDRSKRMDHPVVENADSEGDQRTAIWPVMNDEVALNEKKKSPEQAWAWEPVSLADTDSAHEIPKVEEPEDELHHLRASILDPTPIRPQPPEPFMEPIIKPEMQPEPTFVVESLPYQEASEPRHNDWQAGKQDTLGQECSVKSPPQTPKESLATVHAGENDWRQFLDGVSLPPTPKLQTKLPRARLPRLDITPADDAVIVETPLDEPSQQERLTPVEPPLEPHHAGDAGTAESPTLRKSRHRKSGGSWISFANEGRPRSAAGESVKSERRRSKDDKEAQAPQQHGEHSKKQHRKSNSWLGKPEKGFREWFHSTKK
ncbi:hypothetical protein C7974DRAFT_394923 [Boeremia exigua]|uniref:uncharacterized protein n=1 Tax=Boeremia exigua TaxID=749465 RepID=UPI001E8CEF23|nr:uncharacterized protein C7974DRAFT_394923 [Boeremia exigua]KAH6629645.1 hypothetical protein C7974DRAFT_394923 [Boeremia exigua]